MEVGLCEKIAWSSRRKATFDNLHVMRHEAILENDDEACSEQIPQENVIWCAARLSLFWHVFLR